MNNQLATAKEIVDKLEHGDAEHRRWLHEHAEPIIAAALATEFARGAFEQDQAYMVWGTDDCTECRGLRVTLYYRGSTKCVECQHAAQGK
jgi:hypothetical protein